MRWWIVTAPPRSMAIENQNVTGMDFTILPSNTSMVEWIDGRGEIEYSDRPRLRETFTDITPYVPLLQQFMTRLTGLTLNQAKTIQNDLITALYDNNRQLPFHQTVAAGDYNWEATDASVAAMAATGLPALFDATAGATNSLITNINTGLIPNINQQFTNLVNQINANIVSGINAISGTINSGISAVGNALVDFINNTVLGDSSNPAINTLNAKLQTGSVGGTANAASPGLNGAIAHTGAAFSTTSGVSTVSVASIPLLPGVGTIPNISWLPLGATAMVSLTLAELMTIMRGIAARRSTLTITQNTKLNEVSALTTVAAVIAYDPTSGWS